MIKLVINFLLIGLLLAPTFCVDDTNGNSKYYFKTSVEEINEIINLFSKVTMRDHIVQIRSDKGMAKSFSGMEIEYNVMLQLVEGIALFFTREEKKEDLPLEPCLSILTGGDNSIFEPRIS